MKEKGSYINFLIPKYNFAIIIDVNINIHNSRVLFFKFKNNIYNSKQIKNAVSTIFINSLIKI